MLLQGPYYAIYGNNNPYNITAISHSATNRAIHNFFKPGGCRDRILECRRLRSAEDPYDSGDNLLVNLICRDADDYCGRFPRLKFYGLNDNNLTIQIKHK